MGEVRPDEAVSEPPGVAGLPQPAGRAGQEPLRGAGGERHEPKLGGRGREERISESKPTELREGPEPVPEPIKESVAASVNQTRNSLLQRDYRINPEKLDFGGKKEKFRLNLATEPDPIYS